MERPIDFLGAYFSQLTASGHDVTAEFSYYKYIPQSVLDDRVIVSLNNPTIESIIALINKCPADHEVAFHSRYKFLTHTRKARFLPVIDFMCHANNIKSAAQIARKILPPSLWKSLYFYDSGRSMHGYIKSEITKPDFIDFMGRCLLMNMPNEAELVDTRWVGHRIMAGYGSLRISHNTQQYLLEPRLIGTIADYI